MVALPKQDGAYMKGLYRQMLTKKSTNLQHVRYSVLLSLIGVMALTSIQTKPKDFQTAFQDQEQN